MNLRDRIERLKDLDPERMLVGASVHRYELLPPLSEDEVAAWEEKRRVTLPAEYRAFLREVSGGGAGPGEGLLPLGSKWRGDPAKPFQRGALDGLIPLCRYDGQTWDVLVVTGPHAGTVWNARGGVLDDWYNPDGSGLMTFRPWYEGWLRQVTLALSD